MTACRGSIRALLLYDIAEEIDLAVLRKLLPVPEPARSPVFRLPAPEYVRFERPPVVEVCEPIQLATGNKADARLKYFDYGVVSMEVEIPFESDWPGLIALSNRWIEAGEVEPRALKAARLSVSRVSAALRKPYADWLDEAYYVVLLNSALDGSSEPLSGPDLIARHGHEISQVIRGEVQPLSDSEEREVLSSKLSYYPNDLLVVGWQAALVYDTPQGAAPVMELLEYANTQLLEYRRYDVILTQVLRDARATLERKSGFFSRWRLAGEAEQLNRLRLETAELAERTDTAIKFLSDMFYARAYRMAATKVGAQDYRSLVDQKLRAAGELYEFMMNEFREARGFALELLVILILIIELIPIFRGR